MAEGMKAEEGGLQPRTFFHKVANWGSCYGAGGLAISMQG